MPKTLPKINADLLNKRFISVSRAAKFLQVSPDTLRNWDREGKLVAIRTPGGARRYGTKELIALKTDLIPFKTRSHKGLLTVSQAAKGLNVSLDTIRNWDNSGILESQRTKGGARRFTRAEIDRVQKELGIQPQYLNTLRVTEEKKVTKFEPKVNKFFPWIRITALFAIFLLVLSSIMLLNPYFRSQQKKMDQIYKIIDELAKSLENLQSGVYGIQTGLVGESSAALIEAPPQVFEDSSGLVIKSGLLPITVNSDGEIGCELCLKTTSTYISSVTNSDSTLNISTGEKEVIISLKLDHSNTWSASQSFNEGISLQGSVDQKYNNSTQTPGNFIPISTNSNLSGIFSTGETRLYGIKSNVNILSTSSGGIQESYGGYFTAEGESTGTSTSNAIGIYASAKNADNNFAAIFESGNVGLGTTAPTKGKLVISLDDVSTQPSIYIDSEQSTSTLPVISLESDTTGGSGADTVKFKVNADGSVFSDSGIYSSPADLAEMYFVKDEAKEADLVELTSLDTGEFAVQKALKDSGNKIFGIISTNPGTVLAYDDKLLSKQKPVALVGRVPIKVSDMNGPIQRGDYLTSSSLPGVAVRATSPGIVVGQALEDFAPTKVSETLEESSSTTIGKIEVFVNVSFADPDNFLASLQFDDQGNLIAPKIKASSIVLEKLDDGNLNLDLSSTIQHPSSSIYYDLTGKIASLEQRIKSLENVILASDEGARPKSSDSGVVANAPPQNDNFVLSESSPSALLVELDKLNLTPPDILLATGSATLANIEITDTLSSDKLFIAQDGKISGDFKVFGSTTLGQTAIAGDLIIDGTQSLGGKSINVIGSPECLNENFEAGIKVEDCGTLFIQNSSLAYKVDLFNGLVSIDYKGNLTAQTVTVAEFKVFSNKISGSGKIVSGKREVEIENNLVKPDSRILITPTSQTLMVLAVTEKDEGKKFTVSSPEEAKEDIVFDYFLINEVVN